MGAPPEHTLPPGYVDAWDRHHVLLPCSPKALSATADHTPLWTVICSACEPPPTTLLALLGRLNKIKKAVKSQKGKSGCCCIFAIGDAPLHAPDQDQPRPNFNMNVAPRHPDPKNPEPVKVCLFKTNDCWMGGWPLVRHHYVLAKSATKEDEE